jgi:tRNA threonylcarbamoyladenosine biosynthesis protein TsaB
MAFFVVETRLLLATFAIMTYILSIETATSVCSVALHQQGQLLGIQSLMLDKSHSSYLAVMIEQLLNNCQVRKADLQAVAVSMGPGSYTGLRIGTATAKGLCYALGIPLVAVNTLEGMAYQFKDIPMGVDYLCPMIDARRMEVYCTVMTKGFEIVDQTRPVIVEKGVFDSWLNQGTVMFFGNGSGKCKTVLQAGNSLFADNVKASAATIGYLGGLKLEKGEVEDLAYFQPFYLKAYRTTVPKNKIGVVDEK